MDDSYKPIDPSSPLGQMMEKFKNIDISRLMPSYTLPDYDFINRQLQENIQDIDPIIPEGYFKKTQEYQEESLEMLKSINTNTANLYTLVDLISNANDKQDELIGLISEILTIAKAKDKEEAESLFKKVMGKINETVKSADSMIKIMGWATSIYSMVIAMLNK
jgi:predicted house-cleaning NTP pyrophosphatase (Maf/HAM1 superfamily)